jgi:hypothetical protein
VDSTTKLARHLNITASSKLNLGRENLLKRSS